MSAGVVPAEDDGADPLDRPRLDHRRIVRGGPATAALEGGADALLDGLEPLADQRADDVERAAGLLGLRGDRLGELVAAHLEALEGDDAQADGDEGRVLDRRGDVVEWRFEPWCDAPSWADRRRVGEAVWAG